MELHKRFFSIGLLIFWMMSAIAQSGSNSPYTRYGFGQLSDQSFGNSKAMGGIAYGLRDGMHINASNPASYSAVDSLTFLFDAGISLQNANFQENGVKTNAKNSTIDYIAMQFRLWKRMGLTAGFLPYSTVGYNMSKPGEKKDQYGNSTAVLESRSGEGSVQQVFVGLGYKVSNNLSIGANLSYLYGDAIHSFSTMFNNANAYKSVHAEEFKVNDYKLDFGLQYTQPLGKKHKVNLGLVYSYGHDINGKGYEYWEKYASGSNYPLTQTVDTIQSGFSLPHSFGAGFTYVYNNCLTVGLDYTLQKWADVKFFNKEGQFNNRTKISLGAEYRPNPYSRNYFNRVRYRAGAYYSDPYAKVDGKEGAREYGVSFGFGFPLEVFQSRSILNISGQYVKVNPKVKGMLEENYLRINLGLTFNDRWFMKWKVE